MFTYPAIEVSSKESHESLTTKWDSNSCGYGGLHPLSEIESHKVVDKK